eukprot:TRINITY_DN2073_c0_g1_i3.p1 TRINITY_DN2073_c0_g1~~TRINITY_DN2073_c0_g1_i3.p1  ORF type:complete len:212 (+),score=29.13 TRINITY_DN2073_c0_g1_i3:77-637(+)
MTKAVHDFMCGTRGKGLPLQSPTFLMYPGLATQPIYDTQQVMWVEELEEQWQEIRDECLALVRTSTNFVNIKSSVAENSVWNTYLLVDEGKVHSENVLECPRTWEALRKLPLLEGCSLGYVYVSVVQPGTFITPHCGPTNTKLRCHLPLVRQKEKDGEKQQKKAEKKNRENSEKIIFNQFSVFSQR